jgi:hypothetical protein
MLLDGIGLPRYWAAVWSTMLSSELAASTHTKKLRYLENLYQHVARLGVGPNALDDALGTLNDEALADILETWFVSIRNQPVVTGADEKRWQTGLEFVLSVVAWISKSEANDDRMRRIEARLHRLAALYRQLHVRRDNSVDTVRSLPASTVEALYRLLDPDSHHNPFTRAPTRWLFELVSARYERRSLCITANQPFGEWDKVFPDRAMMVAAVDRLVHHSTIFELNVESYRRRTALQRKHHGPGRPASRATPKNVGVPATQEHQHGIDLTE